MNDPELLASFVREQSESAFRSLVERHAALVLGTARRQTGDAALAEEIVQTVFVLLARKAAGLSGRTVLAGWLYRTTCFVAARARLSEQRRRRREQEAASMQPQVQSDPAWPRVARELDDGLGRLRDTDRNALLLRYVEDRPLREVSVSLGVSEEAAKKRIARALEKLRQLLQQRGCQISAGALAVGLTQEGTANASAALVSAWSTAALTTASAGVAVGSAGAATSTLLGEVLAAWRWVQIKTVLCTGLALVTVLALLPSALRLVSARLGGRPSATATPVEPAGSPAPLPPGSAGAFPGSFILNGQTIAVHPLRLTVLQAGSELPIANAEARFSLMWSMNGERAEPLRTDTHGVVNIPVPESIPEGDRLQQFSVWIRASNCAPRAVMWLSSTGAVLGMVSTQYTVRLEPGIRLSGRVVDDTHRPLPAVAVDALGNSYRGYSYSQDEHGKVTSPPVVRIDEYPDFSGNVSTDGQGIFRLEHFPSDLRALVIALRAADDSHRKFRTPQGRTLTADQIPEISFEELRAGTAQLMMPRGVTVEGEVRGPDGEPVMGAAVLEATQWGNLKVTSENVTDFFGRFWLTNRAPREILLAVSAEGLQSASTAVQIRPGLGPVRFRLAAERPLRGRVVSEFGEAVPDAVVTVPDYIDQNEGLGFRWSGKSDADGRFSWRGAPTNELSYQITASGFSPRLVRLANSTNDQVVTLSTKPISTVRVTGRVTDAETGEPLEAFRVKLCREMDNSIPVRPFRTERGTGGVLEVELAQSEIPVYGSLAYILWIEADGYESVFTPFHRFEEGDLRLDFALTPGGSLEGAVQTPAGAPAGGADLVFVPENDVVLSGRQGVFSSRYTSAKSDATGHFKLNKPPLSRALAVFHESGWRVAALTPGIRTNDVRLLPWGRIEGVLERGGFPVAGEEIGLANLAGDWPGPLAVLHNTRTDADGRFVFDRVPSGEYTVSWQSRSWQRNDQPFVQALQTTATARAGETSVVELRARGRAASARLRARAGARAAGIGWTNAICTLRLAVDLPPEPPRSDYVSQKSHRAARFRWATDPAVQAALRTARTYVGQIAPDGTVQFEAVPPGSYVLEAKAFGPAQSLPGQEGERAAHVQVQAQVQATVNVPDGTDAETDGAASFLGEFTLEAL
jgi:RNA polymerase sigma factor (sigma-70 family)